MTTKRELERILSNLDVFAKPSVTLEQYPTPPDLAATLLHLAALNRDLGDRVVIDLGTGTGILALGAALLGATTVIGFDQDESALAIAQTNERTLNLPTQINWIVGDISNHPFRRTDITVLMNPPFGAQNANIHADRDFLEAASQFASVSYSIHNEGSTEFVTAFSKDNGGGITHAYQAELELDQQYEFHTNDRVTIQSEVFRIEWTETNKS